MRSQQIPPILAVCAWSIMWVGVACHDQSGPTALTPSEPVQPVASTQDQGHNEPPAITMEHIWELAEQGNCRELISTVDMYLQTQRDENTTATCRYLQGDCWRRLGEFERSRTILADVNDWPKYATAYWVSQNGEKIPVRPQCEVALRLVAEQDTCPFPRDSNDYTTLAWKYLNEEKLDTAGFMATGCIDRFRSVAEKQQAAHRREYGDKRPMLDKDPEKNKGILEKYWALYDVGTCYFILGRACERKAALAANKKTVTEACAFYREANKYYDIVVQQFPDAQCFDPSGPWYWSVKDGADERNNRINDGMATLRCP
jgi:tetratricopeptide (TPR) repeat protein